MATVKKIRSDADYEAALARIEDLMDARSGTQEEQELDVLADLVEHYEAKHIPMEFPSVTAAIEFRMEQADLSPRDLVPYLGSRAKVSEVLSGKRSLTMAMARALHEHLGIPADVLLQEPGAKIDEPLTDLDWDRFPIKEMAKRSWIPKAQNIEKAKSYILAMITAAGGREVAEAAFYRKSEHTRSNAKSDAYALKAWCLKVLADANGQKLAAAYRTGTVTPNFLREVAKLSWSVDGPRLAKEYLAQYGIALVALPHLPKTYLDGAALKLGDGRPVIGLTLRYDRIDNFWFCLLHELAHVGRHMDDNSDTSFLDDLSLSGASDLKEVEADQWAEEALVPLADWEASKARFSPTPNAVMKLAQSVGVHPAIVAGKVRHEHKNYRLLTHFVGTGEIRPQFGLTAEGQ